MSLSVRVKIYPNQDETKQHPESGARPGQVEASVMDQVQSVHVVHDWHKCHGPPGQHVPELVVCRIQKRVIRIASELKPTTMHVPKPIDRNVGGGHVARDFKKQKEFDHVGHVEGRRGKKIGCQPIEMLKAGAGHG